VKKMPSWKVKTVSMLSKRWNSSNHIPLEYSRPCWSLVAETISHHTGAME
jgi:hypothetical protein